MVLFRRSVIAFGCDKLSPAVYGTLCHNGYQLECSHLFSKSIGDCMALIRRTTSPFEKVITFLKECIAFVSNNGVRMFLQLLDNPFHALGNSCHAGILPKQSLEWNTGNPLLEKG